MHRMLSKRSGDLRSKDVAIPKVVKSAKSSNLAPEKGKEKRSLQISAAPKTPQRQEGSPRGSILCANPTWPPGSAMFSAVRGDGGACFQQRRTEVIQAAAHMTEAEFQRAGSTIQAISDMHRSQSNGIKRTIGA